MGCQKGACWSHCHYSPDRVSVPLKRVGERGEGKFEEVSWDEALDDIADKMLDAIEEQGPESIIIPFTPEAAPGRPRGSSPDSRAPMTDGNAEFQDFSPGYHLTWGLFNPTSPMDDWFLADLTLIWHANPVYTNIHWYHYLAESRYNGGEVVTIAPDYSPSAIHADYHLPVRIGTDAALALAMCKVIIDAGLYNKRFVQEQTDLPLLVRKDTGRFLRGDEVCRGRARRTSSSGGTLSNADAGAARHAGDDGDRSRPRGQLSRSCSRTGATVEVEPVFARLRATSRTTRRRRRGDLPDPPGQHPQAGAQGGHAEDQDLHRLELGQVLPRRPDGALHGAAAGPHRQLGQEGHRHPLLGHHGHGRRGLHDGRKEAPGQEAAQKHIAALLIAMRQADGGRRPDHDGRR